MGYRYIGSKNKIIDEIVGRIAEIAPFKGHVVDLMCGTAAVSLALRNAGYRVTAVDLMTYSYHHARVALLLKGEPEFLGVRSLIKKYAPSDEMLLFTKSNYVRVIESLNNIPAKKGYFWKEFSVDGAPKNSDRPRNYFSPENAKKIDAVRACIKNLRVKKQLTGLEHSLLLHDLIMSANDVANIAGTYGHFLSRLVGRAKQPFIMKGSNLQVSENSEGHEAIRGYAEDVARKLSCDVCYIDPPYMKRQYAANYHILETLAREDAPEAIGLSGLRPWRDQYSNFCTKTKITESFRQIISGMKCRHFLISYSEDGLLSSEKLVDILKEFGSVEVWSFWNKRFKSNDSKLHPNLKEFVFYLKKNC